MSFAGIQVSSDDPATRFDFEAKVGEGSYGAVYKAKDRITGQEVAVKVLDLQGDDAQAADLKREINILQSCACKQIVAYGGAYVKDGQLWISMEYCGAGSLSDLMAICDTTLGEREIAAVMYQSLMGLEYLHKTKKIHRDIKSGNILLTDDGLCKLADFGVSAELSNTMAKAKTMIGTPYFMAPEVLMNTDYDAKADIWSMGITAYELAVGQPPLADVHPMRAIFQIPNSPPPRLPEDLEFSPQFQQFIECCLQKAPAERLSAGDMMKLPFFNEVRSEAASVKVVLELLQRCKTAIDQWRMLDAEEQAMQNANNPYNQGGEEQYEDDCSGTVAINPQQYNGAQQQFQGTMRVNDSAAAEAQKVRAQHEQYNPAPNYNDGTVLIKPSQRPPQNEDMGTVRIAPQKAQVHPGTLKKNQPAGFSNTSGTMVARPQPGPVGNQHIPPPSNANLNTLSSNSLVSSLSAKSTKQDIENIKLVVEQNRTKDLTQITAFYDQRLRDLDRMLQGK